MNKKTLFFTDIHGSNWAMKEILRIIESECPDKVIFLGDLLYHGPRNPFPKDYNPMEVAENIKRLSVPTVLVKGNCDSEVDEMVLERKFIPRYSFSANGKKIICTHGHKLDKLNKKDAFAVIYGHYHINNLTREDGVYLVNLSSVSLPKPNNESAYAVFDGKNLSVKDFNQKTIFDIE